MDKSIERLKCLGCDAPMFDFVIELLPSAVAAYGRPVIDSHGKKDQITLEWKYMFWIFCGNHNVKVVFNDNPKQILEFTFGQLYEFVRNHNCIPFGLPHAGDQSEFK